MFAANMIIYWLYIELRACSLTNEKHWIVTLCNEETQLQTQNTQQSSPVTSTATPVTQEDVFSLGLCNKTGLEVNRGARELQNWNSEVGSHWDQLQNRGKGKEWEKTHLVFVGL